MKCHDCGEPAQPNRLLAIVGNEHRAYCTEHGRIRWDMGCDKSPGWLRSNPQPAYYTGPLPEFSRD